MNGLLDPIMDLSGRPETSNKGVPGRPGRSKQSEVTNINISYQFIQNFKIIINIFSKF